MKITFNPKLFSPLHWHLMPLLRDPKIRYIYVEGGSSASKTFEICRAIQMDQLAHEYSSMVFRRFHVDIKDSVYETFKITAKSINLNQFQIQQQDLILFEDIDSKIRFRGLDNEESIKGIEGYNVIYNNEWNQFTEPQWSQQRKRLRGRPNQKFICDWNPISAKLWQYSDWLDKDEWIDLPLDLADAPTKWSALNPDYSFKKINKKGNAVWIKVTYRDNFWIVGHPSGNGGFVDHATLDDFEYDRTFKPNFYRIYANGERGIMRTGGEFWKQFDETRHVQPVKLDSNQTLHVSVDNNVNPYISQSIWQPFPEKKQIVQVHEILSRSPFNSAQKAARQLADYLRKIEYNNVLYIYGDPSAKARSTVDINNASFFDKYIAELREQGFNVMDRVLNSAPQVALSGAFINEIYELNYGGWSITISDKCISSVEDYLLVKEDSDGSMKKPKERNKETQVTFEPQGHLSDTKRYFICALLPDVFYKFMNRNRRRSGSVAVTE